MSRWWRTDADSRWATYTLTTGTLTMEIHRKILEWQAAHPTITWIVWGIIWVIVIILLFSPKKTGAI
jgi:hypothetical protein